MHTHIALLRAINVGGRNLIPMADLRAMIESVGHESVQTLLQSGNVVFKAKAGSAALERALEQQTEKRFRFHVDYFVRSAAEWETIIRRNPFPREAKRDPARFVAVCLKDSPSAEQIAALRAAIRGPEVFEADGRQLYAVYPNGQGTSKFTTALIESRLATRGTARNWNTVLKLAALASV
jgi:uncharacterized protein (DUF1697 family)